tara:strand:+ start:145 stop:747 length:603 start_codon:yes stop_codon:yes gene_type:complete
MAKTKIGRKIKNQKKTRRNMCKNTTSNKIKRRGGTNKRVKNSNSSYMPPDILSAICPFLSREDLINFGEADLNSRSAIHKERARHINYENLIRALTLKNLRHERDYFNALRLHTIGQHGHAPEKLEEYLNDLNDKISKFEENTFVRHATQRLRGPNPLPPDKLDMLRCAAEYVLEPDSDDTYSLNLSLSQADSDDDTEVL